MVSTTDGNDFLEQYGGTDVNNIINTLRINDDNKEMCTLKYSPYMDLNTIKTSAQKQKKIHSLLIECTGSKCKIC